MDATLKNHALQFLTGGGEMGTLTREKDWGKTSLGDAADWPQSLKTTLSILLNSKFPMFLFWGPDHICFYNDAYRPSLGNDGKHPDILGQKGEDYWQETWHFIKPLIDQVLAGGEATWNEDQLLPIYRNGKMEDVYWTFSYSPVSDESGKPAGVYVTCTETTKQVVGLGALQEREDQLNYTIEAAELGTWDLDPKTNTFIGNNMLKRWFGLKDTDEIPLPLAINVIESKDRKRVSDAIAKALDPASGGDYDIQYTILVSPGAGPRNVYAKGKALFDKDGVAYRFSGILQDITSNKNIEAALLNIEKRFRNVVMQAPVGITIMMGRDMMVEMANETYLQVVDKTGDEFIGKSLYESLPEVKDAVKPLLNSVLETGEPFYGYEFEVDLNRFGKKQKAFFNFVYQPLRENDGAISGIIVIANDVTEQVQSRHALQQSEQRFKNIVDNSPIAMCIFKGRNFVIEAANQTMLKNLWHRELSEVHGKKLLEVFPELIDQKFPAQLQQVYDTGQPYRETEAEAFIASQLGMKRYYLDYEYAPLRDIEHNVFAIMVTVNDVTEKVEARQLIKESAERLRLATEGTQLATWDLNLQTRDIIYSAPLNKFFGHSEPYVLTHQKMRDQIFAEDLHNVVEKAFDTAMQTGKYFYEARVVHPDKSLHWLRVQGTVIFNDSGVPLRMLGTMMDITEQKRSEQIIEENEKKFRLLADSMPQQIWTSDTQGNLNYYSKAVFDYAGRSKEEIDRLGWIDIVHPDDREENVKAWIHSVTTGEPFLFEHRFKRHDGEYRWQLSRAIPQLDDNGNIQMWVGTSTDIHDHKVFTDNLENLVQQRTQELHQSNSDLVKSNSELQQFAYVASHDLQEPLRKIQTFASRILESEADQLSDKGKDYFNRMQSASIRMQQLILDLLSFSRVNSAHQHFEMTDLNILLQNIREQLRESIEQKGVIIKASPMPSLNVIPYQFDQLLTNLISNSIKFVRQGVVPEININCAIVKGSALDNAAVDGHINYWHISVADNGIGFKPEYGERIFQLFQRLHGREEYTGTGIGLAICKKIVENHRGFITAIGEPGKGATFNIYLPGKV